MKRILFAAALAGCLVFPAAADYWADFEVAIQAYADGAHGEALGRFRPLAERGDNRAQYWLGIMYVEGKGVPHDYVRAHMWLSLAATSGNRAARLGRDGIARRMSAAEIAEAERLAAAWRPAE